MAHKRTSLITAVVFGTIVDVAPTLNGGRFVDCHFKDKSVTLMHICHDNTWKSDNGRHIFAVTESYKSTCSTTRIRKAWTVPLSSADLSMKNPLHSLYELREMGILLDKRSNQEIVDEMEWHLFTEIL